MSGWRPETVSLPAGKFLMGSPRDEPGRLDVEDVQRPVAIEAPFAIGRFAVTVDQFAAFVADSGHRPAERCQQWCGLEWQERPGSFHNPGFAQAGDHPAVCVSWEDAQAYVSWLSSKSGHRFRLPSEAEWEYAARAGTATPYWWGTSIAPHQANYNANTDAATTTPADRLYTAPVGCFEPNSWGLYQVHGNVWEWVEDCWSTDHAGPATEGHARQGPAASKRVLRGGGWRNGPRGLRSARRHAAKPDFRRSDIGFRVARNL